MARRFWRVQESKANGFNCFVIFLQEIFNMNNCEELEKKMCASQLALEQEMARTWPKKTMVDFTIMHNQKIASYGEVVGHEGAYLRIRLDTAKGSLKRVHYSNLV